MDARQSIDDILGDWPFDPGVVSARMVEADDGRELLQMRVDLGILQMEVADRPDGTRPGGYPSCLAWLRARAERQEGEFVLRDEDCFEVDREFLQFYHRRLCWFALREFARAVRDADHTLALMDFVREHSDDDDWIAAHEQHRPLVLFHRIQAAAFGQLEQGGPEGAIDQIQQGLETLRRTFDELGQADAYDDDEMVAQLVQLREWLRREYRIGRTLGEQLSEAVAAEEYERAARLRDEIARRSRP